MKKKARVTSVYVDFAHFVDIEQIKYTEDTQLLNSYENVAIHFTQPLLDFLTIL